MSKEKNKDKTKEKTNESGSRDHSNLLGAFDEIFESSRDSKLSGEYLKSNEAPLNFISEKMGITPIQAVLLSLILECDESITARDFCSHLNTNKIFFYSILKELDTLVEKRIIWAGPKGNDGNCSYRMNAHALDCILKNETLVPESMYCEDWPKFIEKLSNLFNEHRDGLLDERACWREIDEVCKANQQLEIARQFEKWSETLTQNDWRVLVYMCVYQIKFNQALIWGDFDSLFDDQSVKYRACSELENKTSELIKRGLVEVIDNKPPMEPTYQLTDMVKYLFKSPVGNGGATASGTLSNHSDDKHLQSYKEIDRKNLFYNEEAQSQIDVLFNLMQGQNLSKVQSRMAKNGMRTGVCCLLYGGPGTGKTATVLEIARACKRDIFQVNLSELRGRYVGESEQFCQKMWDDYNELVAKSKRTPILLLNECDGILAARMEGALDAVDKMENTIANIFLENMEKQKGIVIATTNLANNLDPAFERRFIYKVRLDKPCLQARQAIWKNMFPELTDDAAATIAKEFDISGGQIENIARKSLVDYTLQNKTITLDSLRNYCKQEGLKEAERPVMGFRMRR